MFLATPNLFNILLKQIKLEEGIVYSDIRNKCIELFEKCLYDSLQIK